MEYFFHPFLDAQLFLNVNLAVEDPNFGPNREILELGAHCGIDPIDLLNLVQDRHNGLNRSNIKHFLELGITSIPYFFHFTRLHDELGYHVNEIKLLMQENICPETIFSYDAKKLFKLLRFDYPYFSRTIQYLALNIRPSTVISLVEAGFPITNEFSLFWDIDVMSYAKKNIPLCEAASFVRLGIKDAFDISLYIEAGVTAEQVHSFFQIGEKFSFEILAYIKAGLEAEQVHSFFQTGVKDIHDIVDYIEEGITAEKAISFFQIGVKLKSDILKYIEARITAQQVSPYLSCPYAQKNGISCPQVVQFIKSKVRPDKIESSIRTKQIFCAVMAIFYSIIIAFVLDRHRSQK